MGGSGFTGSPPPLALALIAMAAIAIAAAAGAIPALMTQRARPARPWPSNSPPVGHGVGRLVKLVG